MGIMAQWRSMRWEVSPNILTALSSISASTKLNAEQSNDRDGSNPTNVKGIQPQSIPVAYTVSIVGGADPRALYEEWKKQTGKKGPLILGRKRFGPATLQLDEVGFRADEVDGTGHVLVATISLSFGQEGKSQKAPVADTTPAPGIAGSAARSASLPTGRTALNIKPSTAEIKAKIG